MTKGMGTLTSVFAMNKGNIEGTSGQAKINKTADSAANYTGNFLESAIYKTPLNPLLSRGIVSEDFADFTMVSNATTINSYEIHKADNTTLTNAKTGINQSNSSTQTYSSVNRIYPNSTTVDDHLSNLEITRGNTVKIYDSSTQTGQKFIEAKTQLNEASNITATETIFTVDGSHGLVVNDIIIIDNEEMLITLVSTNDLTVIRGYNNTTPIIHNDNTNVFRLENINPLWILIYSDDPNTHHFAKITELLKDDVYGDRIEFEPSIGVDIPKDTKFAIFSSLDSNLPKIDSDNQTLVACAYGLQSDSSNLRHYLNTHVSRPFFYFLNGKDKLEPATRYVLRSSSWNGSSHTYTYSTFLTEQEYSTDIIDSGPYTMEATLVDMLYKADNPAAMNFLEYTSNNLALTNGTPDTVTIATDGSFALVDSSLGTYTNLDGTEGTDWGLTGILRDSRFTLDGAEADTYCLDSATDSTVTTLTMDAADFSGASTSNDLRIRFLAHAVDLDHNKMYCSIDSTNHLKHSFRMAHRPNDDGSSYYGHNIGQTRYLHYADSPLTNTIIPNALEMIDYESVTATGGYVDIVLADTQKILAKKMKEGDPIYIHQIFATEEIGKSRNEPIGTVEYSTTHSNINDINVVDLGSKNDLRFLLSSPIPNSKTLTSSRYDPLYDTFTVNASGTLYHFTPNYIVNKSGSLSDEQVMRIIRWRKQDDTEYKLATTTDLSTVPNFSTTAYRSKYSFLVDNIISQIPTDTDMSNYILDYNGATASTNWNRNVRDFQTFIENKNPSDNTRAAINIGEISLEKANSSRINDINLVLRGGQMTGHRIKVEYGDKDNKFLKLKPHLKDERFLESYNRTDYLPYADKLSNVSLYGYPINSDFDAGGSLYRYNIEQSPASITNTHVRGVVSYLDYFAGQFDIEKRIFSGIIESIEQVIEDGMFKLKIKGRNNIAKLLGPMVNKDFKFTEDIVYSTVGPIERMSVLSSINHTTNKGIYEVGTTVILIKSLTYADNTFSTVSTATIGDLLYTTLGIFLGRIYSISGGSDPYTITLEEGIPTRLKDDELIMISGSASAQLTDITPQEIPDETGSSADDLLARGNMVSFSKAMAANPYNTTRVNSLLGASNKGILFTGGNSLGLSSTNAPVTEGSTLVGTSASNHPLAKGYSINNIGKIDYDLPFYCHLADEITNKNTLDYVNLHTVNSLTEYDVVNLTSNNEETIIEIAPICPAILARVDNNPIDGRDKVLVNVGDFAITYRKGYNGTFDFSTWIEELKINDFIFDSLGNLYGKIIDISVGSTGTGSTQAILEGDRIVFTLDRPLTRKITDLGIYKYYTSSDHPQYYAATGIQFTVTSSESNWGGTNYVTSRLYSNTTAGQTFLQKLKEGMRIKIEGGDDKDLTGVFTISHVFTEDDLNNVSVLFYPRKLESGNTTLTDYNAFHTDTGGSLSVRITVLTDYFTQGLYFLNTQGLTQGGVLTLTNPYLSSPNAVDNICKPIKWAGGLYHYITDESVANKASTSYNPNASTHVIYSDMIDRYGNTKWRYFGLQKGKYLSYINRRRKDGQIKDTYSIEKGRVNGYATAYRIADAKWGSDEVRKYPYSYHNNDFAWSIRWYDPNISGYYSEMYDTTSDIKEHPYFLEYLSPESRDFRPIMGSNFADFDKHGTHVTSPEDTDHKVLNYPRFMPRMHDNFRGGDWSEDMEAPLNNDNTNIVYKKFAAYSELTSNAYSYNIDYVIGAANTIDYLASSDSDVFPVAIANRWVKLSNRGDRLLNRVFKLGPSASGVTPIDVLQPPHTSIGSTDYYTVYDGKTSDVASDGYEELTILYPPWIGPKFDGITRAKDHWELPDPKTLRWFIFSPADMYPDSMSRKHHIGYSETIDGSSISRKFTNYNLMLKGKGLFGKSNTYHEYYEGSLEEELENDDQYKMLPISEASILPSEMKRFGLMRLIDCTYDWHFNLIDPERLPADMTQLTTPNFEYTRYQPLKRTPHKITVWDVDSSLSRITTDQSQVTTYFEVGDQLFTDKGQYLGRVRDLTDASGASTIHLVGNYTRSPIMKSDGNKNKYYGYIHICGDGTLSVANQEFNDSFYQFTTKGRGGKNSFTDVHFGEQLNMLQSMVATSHMKIQGVTQAFVQTPYGAVYGTQDLTSEWDTGAATTIEVTDASIYTVGQFVSGKGIPNGTTITAIDTSPTPETLTISKSVVHNSSDLFHLPIGAGQPTWIASTEGTDGGLNITESKFMTHFTRNFAAFEFDGTLVLPPAFRTYYSERTDINSNEYSLSETINAMAPKERLVLDDDAGGRVENDIATEYAHVSNILEWMQSGGNPYGSCDIIVLGNYSIENSISRPPIGGRFGSSFAQACENFPYSKAINSSLGTTSANRNGIKYGNGQMTGGFHDSLSGEYSFAGLQLNNDYFGYSSFVTDEGDTAATYTDIDKSNFIAAGVHTAFSPILDLTNITNELTSNWVNQSNVIADGTNGETDQGVVEFSSINDYEATTANSRSKEGILRIVTRPYNEDANQYPYSKNHFLNFVDLTGMYLVGNFGWKVGDNPTSGAYSVSDSHGYDLFTSLPFNNAATKGPQKLGLISNWEAGVQGRENPIRGRNYGYSNFPAYGSMENAMVSPDHIIYIKEHRRNITGEEVAHELLVDNLPMDKTGVTRFYTNYRVMRPAETCLWKNSPNEIDLYKISAQTTKMPTGANMYEYIPSLNRVNSQGEFVGFDAKASTALTGSRIGENEAVSSMYVAIDMDSRHAQFKDLTGTVTIPLGSNTVTGSGTSFESELQEGDVILLDNQKCYVKTIVSDTSLIIAGRLANDNPLSGSNDAYLLNNTFTVLRDYIHLFNPTGNRNTFKSNNAYNMLLTDGIVKQKISMGVEADYYHDRALCKLSIGKMEEDMLGIVSFGEIFTLKSAVPTNIDDVTSAKIGSTVIIGSEVEDVINNLLSEEDISYDISDNREYPYYVSPNYQGVDIFNAANFAAKYKEKELRIDETGVILIKQSNDLDFQNIELSYNNKDLRIISVTRNKSTFDLFNEIIVYGSGLKSIKRNRKSIDKFGKKTLEDVNMELVSQDDVDNRAKSLLKAHSEGDDRFTVKMSSTGIELVKAGDIITLDFPSEGVPKDTYKIYEIRRELAGLIELEVGTYRKDLANRFAELSIMNKSNAASIRGSQFTSTTSPLDFFDSVKLKELRLVIKRIGLVDTDAFTLGFQTDSERLLDFGATMQPQETITEIIRDEDFI